MEVKGEGELSSKIWLIGEAPGNREERDGRPFVGGSGLLLNGVLQEAGIDRSKCYIDNVMQVRPKGNDFGKFYDDKGKRQPTDILLRGRERIRELISEWRPNVVVLLGNEPMSAVLGYKGVMNWRGSILGFHGVKVIPAIHPNMIMRQYEWRPISVMDFHRIKEEAETSDFKEYYKDNLIINPTFEKTMEMLDFLEEQEYIAFDTETDRQNIMCIGFAWSEQDSICIPIFFQQSQWWTSQEETHIIARMAKLFKNPNIKWIAQNAQYDLTVIRDNWKIPLPELWLDTMIGFHCVYPELKKGLDFLTSIYTKRPYHKGMVGKHGPNKGVGPDNLWTYNNLDCVTTFESAMAIHKELIEFETWDFYKNHSHQLIKPLMAMEKIGCRVDIEKRAEVDANLEKDLIALQLRLDVAVGHELNVASPEQMKEFLYEELKMPPQRNKSTKGLTADEDAIEFLAKKFPNPAFDLILEIRGIRKMLSTYIRAPLDADNRIRCSYLIPGTVTGRLSSRKTIYDTGTNMQNPPRGPIFRSLIIPDEGKMFINADLSQAESRVVAYLADEGRSIRLFEAGIDIHIKTASMFLKRHASTITKEERQLYKQVGHSANYLIGPRTLGKNIGKAEGTARELLNGYYAAYPSIKMWHKDVKSKLRYGRVLTTPLGRRRIFFSRWSQQLIREAVAHVPQSTIGDLLNKGLIRAWNNMPDGWDMLLQLHDSVLVQLPIGTDPTHIWKFFKHYFEIPLTINGKTFVIPIDIKTGMDWGNMKDLEVPN